MTKSRNIHPKIEKNCIKCDNLFEGTARSGYCPSCKIFIHKQNITNWDKINSTRRNEISKKYRVNNHVKYLESIKKYRDKNKDNEQYKKKRKEQGRKSYYKHQDKRLKEKQIYHIKNQEKINSYCKDWRLNNKDKVMAYNANIRTRDPISPDTIKEIFAIYNYECMYCDSKKDLTLEHILPLSRDGDNFYGNLGVACKICNSSKGNKTIVEFKEYLELKYSLF